MGLSLRASIDRRRLQGSRNTVRLVVGYGGGTHHSGKTYAQLGAELSYGTDKIPARPHLEEGLEENSSDVRAAIYDYLQDPVGHRDPSIIGDAMVQAVKDYVHSGALADNAPATIKRKGRNEPLVDLGDLMDNLGYVVLRGSSANAEPEDAYEEPEDRE